jgi:hypothetical protein
MTSTCQEAPKEFEAVRQKIWHPGQVADCVRGADWRSVARNGCKVDTGFLKDVYMQASWR